MYHIFIQTKYRILSMIEDIVLPLFLLGVCIFFYCFFTMVYVNILENRLKSYLEQYYPYEYELLYTYYLAHASNVNRIWDFLYSDRLDSDERVKDLKNRIKTRSKNALYGMLFFLLILILTILISKI
jgi:hypothetical protein